MSYVLDSEDSAQFTSDTEGGEMKMRALYQSMRMVLQFLASTITACFCAKSNNSMELNYLAILRPITVISLKGRTLVGVEKCFL